MKLLMIFLTTILCGFAAHAISGYQGNFLPGVSVAIASGDQSSAVVSLKGFVPVGVQTPAALTGTALTFEVCNSTGSSCVPLKVTTSGTALSYTVTTSSYYAFDPVPFNGVQFLKLKSGTAEGANRVLLLSLKGL